MKTNKVTLVAAMLATALLVGSSALAQVTEDTTSTPDQESSEETTTPTTNQETTEQATSAPTQGGTENATPTTTQEATEGATLAPAQTPAPAASPAYALSADGQSLVINGTVEVPCADIFRDEQAELAALGEYPTVAPDEARACEELGVPN